MWVGTYNEQGAGLARPERRSNVIVGDGAFSMAGTELAGARTTCTRW